MKQIAALTLLLITLSISSFAQAPAPKEKMTLEEKKEKNAARDARVSTKNDYSIFRKQITALKEYADEKKKVPKIQQHSLTLVKIVIAIDSVDESDTSKVLVGYIVRNNGDDATMLYDLTFDRTLKKIATIKRDQEGIEADKDEKEEQIDRKENTPAKPGVHKKTGDDDDDEPEEKPVKKTKDRDDD